MDRAYSVLDIKSVNVEQRIIEGIASTPSVDRGGDSMVPSGAVFSLPLPFLWKHQDPIGEVFAADVRPEGIYIKAKVSTVEKPGRVKDLVDEAWASFTAKPPLVRGLSIGWKGIEAEPIKGTKFTRFLKWFLGEISAVVVPMNVEATITAVKSLDQALAAIGTEPAIDPPSAGVSASVVHLTRKGVTPMKKTITERIAAFEAERAAKTARLEAIQDAAGDEGRTKDEAEKDEFKTLKTEIDSIDEELVDLRSMEKMQITKAVVPNGTDPVKASESRSGVQFLKKELPKGTGFTRLAMAIAAGRGSRLEAMDYAKRWESSSPEVGMALKSLGMVTPESMMAVKAAVIAGTTTDSDWAAPLVVYQNLASEFVELLRPETIIGKIPGLRNVPFNVSMPTQTQGSTVGWVGQGVAKPVSELKFGQLTLGMAKAAGIVVLSEELVRSSSPSAEAIVRQDLIATMAAFLDVQFIDPSVALVANVSPASITNGITPVESTGVNAAAFRADFKTLVAGMLAAGINSLSGAVWIMTETQALAFSLMQTSLGNPEFPGITMTGGTFMGLPVVASEAVPAEGGSPAGNRIILVLPREILLADEGGVMIDVSREASLQMDSAPDNPATASTVMVSLWQNNLVGLRAERFINWVRRRTAAVGMIEGAVYTG